MKSRKASYSCGCAVEDCEYDVLYIGVVVTLAYGFVNAYLLRCVILSKSTKMRQRMIEMFVTVILPIIYMEVIKT